MHEIRCSRTETERLTACPWARTEVAPPGCDLLPLHTMEPCLAGAKHHAVHTALRNVVLCACKARFHSLFFYFLFPIFDFHRPTLLSLLSLWHNIKQIQNRDQITNIGPLQRPSDPDQLSIGSSDTRLERCLPYGLARPLLRPANVLSADILNDIPALRTHPVTPINFLSARQTLGLNAVCRTAWQDRFSGLRTFRWPTFRMTFLLCAHTQ